ncbi:hypothetical protein CNYM01_11601 [Colletotrichum nymphaeae SA-01]|uniref:CCHC-type domain-containing protein n=1 Tax=Colletotrichum nymphaeae SA-01 TaxID=1460502 RepID=A0A135S742_9PEZI|nr:hypothetical protein CNYM01_11601 [Colletotrichum nymphaeae SA-01]
MSTHSRGEHSSRGYRDSQERSMRNYDYDRTRGSAEPPLLGKLRVEFDHRRNPPVQITDPSALGGNIVHHDDGFFAYQSSVEASAEAFAMIVRAARGRRVHSLVWFEDHPSPSRARPSPASEQRFDARPSFREESLDTRPSSHQRPDNHRLSRQRHRQISDVQSVDTPFDNASIALSHTEEPCGPIGRRRLGDLDSARMPPPHRPSLDSRGAMNTMAPRRVSSLESLRSTGTARRISSYGSLEQNRGVSRDPIRSPPGLNRPVSYDPPRADTRDRPLSPRPVRSDRRAPLSLLPRPSSKTIPWDARVPIPSLERDLEPPPGQTPNETVSNTPSKRMMSSPHPKPVVMFETPSVVPCKRSERASSSPGSPGYMSSKARGKQPRLRHQSPPPVLGSVFGSIHSSESDEPEFKVIKGSNGDYSVKFKARQLQPIIGTPQHRCCNCDKKGHAAIDCVLPQPDGFVWGCVWCNSRTHDWDDCDVQDKPRTPEVVFYMLIVRRARKPPIVTKVSWYTMFMDAHRAYKLQVREPGTSVSAMEILVDMALRAGFPWTHGRSIWMRVHDPDSILDYDYTKMSTCPLPADPATRDIDTLTKTR